MDFISLLQTQVPAGNGLITIGMLVAMLAIMYLLIIRPQRKEQKKVQEMINALKKGDKIVSIGGIHGSVVSLDERTVVIKVDENCKLRLSRNAISSVITDTKDSEHSKGESSKEEKADNSESETN